MSPLIRYPGSTVVLPPRLFGSLTYYAVLAQYPAAVIDAATRYNKNTKSVHRYDIVDTSGRLSLTVPVSRPSGATRWCDVAVSGHGRWWEEQPTALESAYGRTPFFEFYIDRLLSLFSAPCADSPEPITALCARADAIIRKILSIDTIVLADVAHVPAGSAVTDLRRDFEARTAAIAAAAAYRQLRPDATPGTLSVLDAIFNLGPEAALLLASLPDAGNNL